MYHHLWPKRSDVSFLSLESASLCYVHSANDSYSRTKVANWVTKAFTCRLAINPSEEDSLLALSALWGSLLCYCCVFVLPSGLLPKLFSTLQSHKACFSVVHGQSCFGDLCSHAVNCVWKGSASSSRDLSVPMRFPRGDSSAKLPSSLRWEKGRPSSLDAVASAVSPATVGFNWPPS